MNVTIECSKLYITQNGFSFRPTGGTKIRMVGPTRIDFRAPGIPGATAV